MTPYYEDEWATIYHGDCRDVLPQIRPSTVDVLLTDPPYGAEFGGFRGSPLAMEGDGETVGFRLLRQALVEARFALRPDAHAYVFCRWSGWASFHDAIHPFIPVRNALIWHKERGAMGDLKRQWAADYEVVIYGGLGDRGLAGKRESAVIRGFGPLGAISSRYHPTEKPVPLLSFLLSKSLPNGGRVLDPFMGTGGSIVAARAGGGRGIGIEIEERYCEVSAERLSQGVLGLEAAPPVRAGVGEAPPGNPEEVA